MITRFEWTNAKSVNDALTQLEGKALLKAGGIDLMDRLKEGIDAPSRLVNIRTIPGLDRISADANGLRIGPLVTLAQLDADKSVRANYTALADAAGHAATPQIRNMATIGGNLLQRPRCWYFRNEQFHCFKKGGNKCFAQEGENEYHAIFDNRLCAIVHPSAVGVALTALGAKLELTSKSGKRDVAIEDFWIRPEQDMNRENALASGEMITAITIPKVDGKSAYMKLGEKESFDWPLAEVAVVLTETARGVERASIVLGAAAPTPRRAIAAEVALKGKPLTEASARAAATAAVEDATPLANNAYKLPIFAAVIRRTIMAAGGATTA
jgi:xanthine dehydrogenase YagS FAD-binding subunit